MVGSLLQDSDASFMTTHAPFRLEPQEAVSLDDETPTFEEMAAKLFSLEVREDKGPEDAAELARHPDERVPMLLLLALRNWDGQDQATLRTMVTEHALERADTEGELWSPVLDTAEACLPSGLVLGAHTSGSIKGETRERLDEKLHRLGDWIAEQGDPEALEPLYHARSWKVVQKIAQRAQVASPEQIERLVSRHSLDTARNSALIKRYSRELLEVSLPHFWNESEGGQGHRSHLIEAILTHGDPEPDAETLEPLRRSLETIPEENARAGIRTVLKSTHLPEEVLETLIRRGSSFVRPSMLHTQRHFTPRLWELLSEHGHDPTDGLSGVRDDEVGEDYIRFLWRTVERDGETLRRIAGCQATPRDVMDELLSGRLKKEVVRRAIDRLAHEDDDELMARAIRKASVEELENRLSGLVQTRGTSDRVLATYLETLLKKNRREKAETIFMTQTRKESRKLPEDLLSSFLHSRDRKVRERAFACLGGVERPSPEAGTDERERGPGRRGPSRAP